MRPPFNTNLIRTDFNVGMCIISCKAVDRLPQHVDRPKSWRASRFRDIREGLFEIEKPQIYSRAHLRPKPKAYNDQRWNYYKFIRIFISLGNKEMI
jgi:hypothetical protein